ncbi:MAG: ketopantoate reductase family protein [Lachnospiraceae bacterium]|nr:ketopantoate reductase family protein [Lachnospiraceae bacterium]
MKRIKHTAIVGMGALGLLYGQQIQEALGREAVSFIMDEERFMRHKEDVYCINGKVMEFNMTRASETKQADLVIVATKSTGLESALDVMAPAVGEDTIIISVLNGISSEGILAERFGAERVLGCVAIGMDAMREGSKLQYCSKGRLQIGTLVNDQEEMLDRVVSFFEEIGQTYEVKEDIMQAMWSKFLLNVGVNQTCMVYETTYAGVLQEGEAREQMLGAMQEVLKVGQAEGIDISEADLQRALTITAGLKPDGYPSMRQDAIAHRASEVELFAGTIVKLAKKHEIAVPVNSYYYEKIKGMEETY